jgi:general stress protein YciG
MSLEQRTAISRKGGKAVDPDKRSFAKDRNLAASAGRLGGQQSRGGGRPKSAPELFTEEES